MSWSESQLTQQFIRQLKISPLNQNTILGKKRFKDVLEIRKENSRQVQMTVYFYQTAYQLIFM